MRCISMDNLPPENELPGELQGDVFTNAIEEALLVFSHSQAFVGIIGGESSMLSGRSSVSVDENSFADIKGASTLDGIMVVSDKSHLEITSGSMQSHAYSGPNRPLIPIESGHLFRGNPAGDSGAK